MKPTLLLVEDDEVFARAITRALDLRGYAVDHTLSAEAAVRAMAEVKFDYAILDLNLGGHTSLSLIQPLRKANPEMRILMLTGYALIAEGHEASPSQVEKAESILEPMSVRRLEWDHIQKVLAENDGNVSETARQLKMHRRTLQRKLQKRPVAS